jgi:division protein CdvB (Snf7/Vps24/ESCRT-III family)
VDFDFALSGEGARAMFGGDKKDPKEVAKDARKDIKSGQRDIERQIRDLDRAEQRALADARVAAKKGDVQGARVLAGEVVRVRNAKLRMTATKSQLGSVALRTHESEAVMTQARAMQTAGKAMHAANAQLDPKQMAAVLREFEKQSGSADLRTEMLDDLFAGEDNDEEADEAVGRIFEELSIETADKLGAAPRHTVAAQPQPQRQETEDDILRQLTALK